MNSFTAYRSELKEERAAQSEFLVVVIMVGLALNLVASLLWGTIEDLSNSVKIASVLVLFFVCTIYAIFIIYFRPHPSKTRRYYCSYYFLLMPQAMKYQIIRRNSLTSGPILRYIGENLNWENVEPTSMESILDLIYPFLILEPLIFTFQNFWTEVKEWTDERLHVKNFNDEIVVSVSQEKLGGKLLGPDKLWKIISKDIPKKFFISDFFENNFNPDLRLKIPPRANLAVINKAGKRALQIDTPHLTISIYGGFVALPSEISSVDLQFTCKIRHKRLSRFRRDYEPYYIWEHRILNSLEEYFVQNGANHSPNLETFDYRDTLVSLIVGDKKSRKYYWSMHGHGLSDKVKEIPINDRVFFKSVNIAENYGFSKAD
jgi:hypothetical protein